MRRLRGWLQRVVGLFRKQQSESEFAAEIDTHLAMHVEDNLRAGMTPQEARRQALIKLGGLEQTKEIYRDRRGLPFLETLFQDLRFAARMLRKNPGFTVVAILTLALGIGANTAIFSIIEAVLLRALPYKDPGRLALLVSPQDRELGGFLYTDIQLCQSQSLSFEDIAIYYRDTGFSRVTVANPGEPESVQAAFVSANFFSLLGVPPRIGRVFTKDEETRREPVVVLSNDFSLRHFGDNPDVVGRMLRINGIDSQIIGVMPATFHFPARDQQFWAPLTTNPYWDDPSLTTNIDPNHNSAYYGRWQAVGRLRPGTTLQLAQAEIKTIFARLQSAAPDFRRDTRMEVAPLRVQLDGNTRVAFFIFFGAVGFVLLIACSNVANLILARGAVRQREMAVRTALGATRGRLIRQLLGESAALAVLSGFIGLLIAAASVRALIAFAPAGIPRLDEAGIDTGVLAFTLTLCLLTTLLSGVAPAWKISRTNPNVALNLGGKGIAGSVSLNRTRSILVATEFALAVVLLAGAGLLIRSFLAVESVDKGFDSGQVLTMNLRFASAQPQVKSSLYQEALEHVRVIPGVEMAGATSGLFELDTPNNLGLRTIEGRAAESKEDWTPMNWNMIRGDYLQAMGASLLRGRYFSESDSPDSPLVAIIDESMARRYWPGKDPIGKRFKGQDARGHNDEWLTVIGVVRDMRRSGLERRPQPHVYEWYRQANENDTRDLVVRVAGKPQVVAALIRGVVRGIDSNAVLSPVTTLEQQLSDQLSPRRFETWLLSLFSAIALLLAAVGIFGVMHYSVVQRTREIGVRIALGAQRRDILRVVMGEGIAMACVGVAAGLIGAFGLTKYLRSLLFEIQPNDPVTFMLTTVVLVAVALVACWAPARRAMCVDPMVALRYE